MAIATTKYVRNPLYVDAVKVTRDNFLELSFWCRGSIKNNDGSEVNEGTQIDPETQHIQLQKVNNPKNQRQTQAHISDWILRSDKGFKIYTDQAFKNSFTKVQGQVADAAVQAAKPQPTTQEEAPMEQQDQQPIPDDQTPGENQGQIETEQVSPGGEPPQEQTSDDSALQTPQPDAPVETTPEGVEDQDAEAEPAATPDETPGDAPPVQ